MASTHLLSVSTLSAVIVQGRTVFAAVGRLVPPPHGEPLVLVGGEVGPVDGMDDGETIARSRRASASVRGLPSDTASGSGLGSFAPRGLLAGDGVRNGRRVGATS